MHLRLGIFARSDDDTNAPSAKERLLNLAEILPADSPEDLDDEAKKCLHIIRRGTLKMFETLQEPIRAGRCDQLSLILQHDERE